MVKLRDMTYGECRNLYEIVQRVGRDHSSRYEPNAAMLDLIIAHGSCPLDFKKLLDADEFNFLHDIGGINAKLDRVTGKLTDCFLPRCAKPEDPTDLEFRRRDAVLAGLNLYEAWLRDGKMDQAMVREIATNDDTHGGLTIEESMELREELNQ